MFQPISRFVPEVSPPQRKVGFNEKLFWTAMALALYLVMSEVPLYLPFDPTEGDPLLYLRVIFASNRGSLMELGIGPIVTAGIILQLLVGSNMIQCDMSNPDDRALFTTATKVFSIVMIGVQASAYLIGGMYGPLPLARSMIVFIQLLFAGILLMLMDETLQKGWGIGSGISLFIMAGVAQTIAWSCLSPLPAFEEAGRQSGALIAFFQTILGGQSLGSVFFREGNNPTMLGFIATVVVFLVVIYAEGVRVELPISYARYRGFRGRYPIKLLYVSNLPVIFASALFANIYFISQLLWSQPWGRNNFWVSLLGQYATVSQNGGSQVVPVGGLVYYVISPQNLSDVVGDPFRALGFVTIMIAFCVVFSLTWLEVGGLGPRMVAKQLIDSGMQIPGFRRSSKPIESLLNRYIPTVAVLGGVLVGLIASVANFFGVFGTGMGILLAVGILYQYYQLLMQERVAEMHPALSRFLGG
jgi:preprotein translocase SecY subunit